MLIECKVVSLHSIPSGQYPSLRQVTLSWQLVKSCVEARFVSGN